MELGFDLDDFYPLIFTCFNEAEMRTLWSLEHAAAELKGYETGENSPSFKEDDFYPGLDVDNLYHYDNQISAFTKLLGSSNLATQYLSDKSRFYLARGKCKQKGPTHRDNLNDLIRAFCSTSGFRFRLSHSSDLPFRQRWPTMANIQRRSLE